MRSYLPGPLLAAVLLAAPAAGQSGRDSPATLDVFFKMSAACNAYYEIEGNAVEAATMERLATQMIDIAAARGGNARISRDRFDELVAQTLIGLMDNRSFRETLAEQCPRLESMVDDEK